MNVKEQLGIIRAYWVVEDRMERMCCDMNRGDLIKQGDLIRSQSLHNSKDVPVMGTEQRDAGR